MKTILACVLLLGALGMAGQIPTGEKSWTVLPVGETKTVLSQCSRVAPRPGEPFWSPTPAQIEELEKRLPVYLRKQRRSEQADQLSSRYLRQYVGITREGRKLIYLNAFPKEVVDMYCRVGAKSDSGDCRNHWRVQGIFVCDGGDDFWGVEYDPASKEFSGLAFNGVA